MVEGYAGRSRPTRVTPRVVRHPGRLVALAFLAVAGAGTLLLMLPAARAGPGGAPLLTALFTSTSAVSVTGLTVVETSAYWTAFGQVLIMLLMQAGGFGIVTAATLLTLLVSDRLGLRTRLLAQAEARHGVGIANTRGVLAKVAATMLAAEAVVALLFAVRLLLAYDVSIGTAAWHGIFHAVSAVNNGGFTLYPGSLSPFRGDWWICVPVVLGVIVGSTGYPVLFELSGNWRRPGNWSIHTRLTVIGTLVLLAGGFTVLLGIEWTNPATLGPLATDQKVLTGLLESATIRSAGFATVDYSSMRPESLAAVIALMFIGGGAASTAGGIKVTTFLLLAYVVKAEITGEPDVVVGHRRVPESASRQALTVALLGVGVVAAGTFGVVATGAFGLDQALFTATSAFGTVGLALGSPSALSAAAQIVMLLLMFVGRVGPIVVASGLALRTRRRLYHYPEERPIIG